MFSARVAKKRATYLLINVYIYNTVLFEGGNERVSMTRHFHFNYDCYIGTNETEQKKFIIIIIIYYKLIFTQQFSRYSIEIEFVGKVFVSVSKCDTCTCHNENSRCFKSILGSFLGVEQKS